MKKSVLTSVASFSIACLFTTPSSAADVESAIIPTERGAVVESGRSRDHVGETRLTWRERITSMREIV